MNNPSPSPDVSGTARYMFIAAWVIGLLLLSGLFGGWLDHRDNPNGEPGGAWLGGGAPELVLHANAQGQFVVDGHINSESVRFLVDTGATDVALSTALARRLGLPQLGQVVGATANGRVTGWRSRIDRVRIGGLQLRDVSATVLPNMADDMALLGMSALKRLELVQRDRRLILRVPSSAG